MKKFFLNVFLLSGLVLSIASCSSDDDGGNSGAADQLVVTIDGETLTFTTILVDEETYTDDGETYTELYVTATIGTDVSRIIQFDLELGDTGADALYYFQYTVDGQSYFYNFDDAFNAVVTVNNGSRLTMTFSGDLEGYDQEAQENVSITLSNGSVDVAY